MNEVESRTTRRRWYQFSLWVLFVLMTASRWRCYFSHTFTTGCPHHFLKLSSVVVQDSPIPPEPESFLKSVPFRAMPAAIG